MSNYYFHRSAGPFGSRQRSAGPFTILLFSYFTISFPSRPRFLHQCRTTIFTVGRTVYYVIVLLFYYLISIQAKVFASRVAKPECRTTIFTGRPDSLRVFLHLGQPILHVGSRFCMSAKRIPLHRSCGSLQFSLQFCSSAARAVHKQQRAGLAPESEACVVGQRVLRQPEPSQRLS